MDHFPTRCTLLLTLTVLACGCSDARRVRLATTTSTQNSGLLELLLPGFERATGIEVEVVAAGTGQVLELGRRGDVDLVMVHARSLEDEFVNDGYGVERRDVMWNDFVIVGPPSDPAGLRGGSSAARAFDKIAVTHSQFVSRGDDSGTHVRERVVWQQTRAGMPTNQPFYLVSGQGMGKSLLIADQKRAYILTDRGTWLAFSKRLDLEVMVEGDSTLRNPYGAILVNPERHAHVRHESARRLLDYLVSSEARSVIEQYAIDGQLLFHPAREAD